MSVRFLITIKNRCSGYDYVRPPPPPQAPPNQPPDRRPPGSQPPPAPRGPQYFNMDPPDAPDQPMGPPDAPDQPMGPAPSMQSFGGPPDVPGTGRSRIPRETQSGPDANMNPVVSGGGQPKKGRDGPYDKPSGDLGPPADGIMNVPFPIGPSNPVPTVPVTPTPKAIVRRNRPGPYEAPVEEEETLVPHDGAMDLPFPMGPQPTAIEEDRSMSSSFVPKRPSETPLAATSTKKPASSPQSWPPPPL